MKYVLTILLLILSVCASPNLTHAEQLFCPEAINVQESVTDVPAEWTPVSDGGRHPLKGIAFFDGNPAKMANLAPEKENKKKGRLYSIWHFDPKTANNLWISCSYGRTAMTFTRPVSKQYSQCTITSDLTMTVDGVPSMISIECK